MKKLVSLLIIALVGMTIIGCGRTDKKDTKEKSNQISAVTTFYPMYEFTKAVIGDEGTVEMLIPAGSEPHDFEPSAKDITKIAHADLFVYNSSALEKWAKKMDTVDNNQTTIVEAAKGIQLAESEANSDEASELDPHVWLDPVLAQQEVSTIKDALIKRFPEKKTLFEENANRYIQQLKQLDQKFKQTFEKAKQRSFVTQHAAFGYLAKRYQLKQEAVSGLSPEEEPSANRLAELKTFVKKNHISIIYFEENTTSKVAETLASETGIKTSVLDPIEGITKDEIQKGVTYLSVMEENLHHLQQAIK